MSRPPGPPPPPHDPRLPWPMRSPENPRQPWPTVPNGRSTSWPGSHWCAEHSRWEWNRLEPPADITGIEMVEVPQGYGRHHDRPVSQGAAASAAVLLAIPVAILILMLIILELV